MNDFLSEAADWIRNNPGKAAGVFIGFLAGLLILTLGPVQTLLIALFVFIGYIIGKLKDDDVSVIDQIKRIFNRDR